MLDGSESSRPRGRWRLDVMPSLDALAEFRMLTSNYSAEYGLSSAATMTTVIRSGTRQFHASAWEFLRNDALDARNYFNRAPSEGGRTAVQHLRFQPRRPGSFLEEPSAQFFFYNMEWRSLIQGQTLNQTVPCPAPTAATSAATLIMVPTAAQVVSARFWRNTLAGWTYAGRALSQQHHSG